MHLYRCDMNSGCVASLVSIDCVFLFFVLCFVLFRLSSWTNVEMQKQLSRLCSRRYGIWIWSWNDDNRSTVKWKFSWSAHGWLPNRRTNIENSCTRLSCVFVYVTVQMCRKTRARVCMCLGWSKTKTQLGFVWTGILEILHFTKLQIFLQLFYSRYLNIIFNWLQEKFPNFELELLWSWQQLIHIFFINIFSN